MKKIEKNMFVRDPKTARIGKEILPFEMGHLPEFFQKKAEVELHETPEKVAQCTKQLREMMKNDRRLKDYEANDDILGQFLRMRKHNVDRAFATLRTGEKFLRKHAEFFTNFNCGETIKVAVERIITILPWRCQDGCVVIWAQLNNWDPDYFRINEVKRMIIIMLFSALQDPMTQVNGFKVIFDVKIKYLKLVREFTPSNLWMLYHGTQDCVPGRFKEVHIVNDSIPFKTAWFIIKQFFSEKLKRRVHFHSTPGSLLEHFPSAILPAKYGGELARDPHAETEAWFKEIMTPERLEQMGGGLFKNVRQML